VCGRRCPGRDHGGAAIVVGRAFRRRTLDHRARLRTHYARVVAGADPHCLTGADGAHVFDQANRGSRGDRARWRPSSRPRRAAGVASGLSRRRRGRPGRRRHLASDARDTRWGTNAVAAGVARRGRRAVASRVRQRRCSRCSR
jgi:hypothetical protein